MTTLGYQLVSGVQNPADEPLLTIRQVCDWLGICDTTLMKIRKKLLLIPAPITGAVRFRPADVRAYIERVQEEERARISSGPAASGPCTDRHA
jgi:predicted DNA-binding transcriptional regulator AlpA